MRAKFIVTENFQDYKEPNMFIGTISCCGKCCTEQGIPFGVCQNDPWRAQSFKHYEDSEIIEKYLADPISKAVVFGGLEPFEQFDEVYDFIRCLRVNYGNFDPVIIYTGYYENEILSSVELLKQFKNIVVKYGRFLIGHEKHFDDVLGVYLASPNQYAVKIS